MTAEHSGYPINQPLEFLAPRSPDIRVRPKTTANLVQRCNITYCETHGVGLQMDVFQHPERRNGLGIVDIVSREWFGDRIRLNQHIGLGLMDVLCEQGFTVFAVSPGSVGLFSGLELLNHVYAGIRFVKKHAADFGANPACLGITGMSAGAHLAALAALQPRAAVPRKELPGTTVRAAGLFFPLTDLLDLGVGRFQAGTAGAFSERLLFAEGLDGQEAAATEARLRELSPVHVIPLSPTPFLIFHGDADAIAPCEHSRAFAAALGKAGGQAECVIVEGGAHPWPDMRPQIARMGAWFGHMLTS